MPWAMLRSAPSALVGRLEVWKVESARILGHDDAPATVGAASLDLSDGQLDIPEGIVVAAMKRSGAMLMESVR
jgi:hypothetical protein